MIGQHAYIQTGNRIVQRNEAGMDEKAIPAAAKVEAELPGAVRLTGAVLGSTLKPELSRCRNCSGRIPFKSLTTRL